MASARESFTCPDCKALRLTCCLELQMNQVRYFLSSGRADLLVQDHGGILSPKLVLGRNVWLCGIDRAPSH